MYYGQAKAGGRQHRKNLGHNLRLAARNYKAWKAELRIAVKSENRAASIRRSYWAEFAQRYRDTINNRVDLADTSKSYLFQRLASIEATWPDARGFKRSDEKPPRALPSVDVTTLTIESMAAWAASYAECYSPTAYNNTIAVFRSVLQEAVEAKVLRANPVDGLSRIGEEPRENKWLPSPEQWDLIISRIRQFGRGPCRRAADLAELLAYTGCRLSEVRRIRWNDIDFERKSIIIFGSKCRRSKGKFRLRVIPLHSRLLAVLERLRPPKQVELQSSESVAPARECLGTLQRACRELGFSKLTHHDLRCVFATWCVERGVDIPTIADMLGHSDRGKLLMHRYRHLRIEHLKAVGTKLVF